MENNLSERYKKTANSFVLNVQRAMRVAGRSDDEYPKNMTQVFLSKTAGVARSTLASHRELNNNSKKTPNPTLEKLCAIAETLGVPPAFLLMRPEDWVRLSQVIEYYSSLKHSKNIHPIFSQIANCGSLPPEEQANLALKFARQLEITIQPSQDLLQSLSNEDKDEIRNKVNRQRQSIFTSSSLPPISHMRPEERLTAFVVSIILGAHNQ